MTPDPFTHLPHLRGRLTPAEQSGVRVTPTVLAEWDLRARELGRPDDWRLPCEQREATRQAVLAAHPPGQDLWVYGYGSLMWDPGIHFTEVRLAELHGYQRRFTYRITGGRGTVECPALMLALEPQPGCCRGLAFRIASDRADAESEILWRREMIRGGYVPAFLPMATPQGDIRALVFIANPAHPEYAGEQALAETVGIIATAAGPLGTNRHYVEQLAAQLALLDIEDGYINTLLHHLTASHGPNTP
jgi:cation transport protein ChaC